ncbi:hypothetical protein Hanom_Chr07g00627531 [Helianthus anomalus]
MDVGFTSNPNQVKLSYSYLFLNSIHSECLKRLFNCVFVLLCHLIRNTKHIPFCSSIVYNKFAANKPYSYCLKTAPNLT